MSVTATVRLELALRAYEQAVTADAPFEYFRFESVDGASTPNTMVAGAVGTIVGGATHSLISLLAEGGYSLAFDGSTGYVTGDYQTWFDAAPYSVECWFVSSAAATVRTLVGHYSAGTGKGGSLSVTAAGAIRFAVNNWTSAASLFDVTRGAGLHDGNWHHVVATYGSNTVRIYIDGAQSGASAADTGVGVGTDPGGIPTVIGALDATPTTPFLGNIDEVAIYATALSAARVLAHYTAAQWTDVTADVLQTHPIELTYGIGGTTPLDRVADTGTLTFALDNSETNSAATIGYYSPNHASARVGFARYIRVRYSLLYSGTRYYKFSGFLDTIDPLPGSKLERATLCSAVDYMEVLSRTQVQIATSTNALSNALLTTLLDAVEDATGIVGPERSFDSGKDTLPYGFVGGSSFTNGLEEVQRITMSEFGYTYITGDTTNAGRGVLIFENRYDRPNNTTNLSTLTNTQTGLEAPSTMGDIYNDVQVSIHPRQVSAAGIVLYSSDAVQLLDANQVLKVTGSYRDPDQTAAQVAGVSMIAPVSGTDWTANSLADGTGTNLTANVTVTAFLAGTAAFFTITNTSSTTPCYLTSLQVRGTGLFDYDGQTIQSTDSTSMRTFGKNTLAIDMPYQPSPVVALNIADALKAGWATSGTWEGEQSLGKRVTFIASTSDALMLAALAREPGDRIGLVETVTGISGSHGTMPYTRGFVINGVALTVDKASSTTCSWTLAPAEILRANADVLVVGGGGGGGKGSTVARGGGGGGAGGMTWGKVPLSAGMGAITVTVGGSGAGATTTALQGSDGGQSSFINSGATVSVIGIGGGGGGSSDAGAGAGRNGGSGGGAGNAGGVSALGGAGVQSGVGIQTGINQGVFAGGNNSASGGTGGSGGAGGGASAVGANGTTSGVAPATTGGAGVALAISGASVTYAVGGNGGAANGGVNGTAGTANRGNGGGGGGGMGAPSTGGAGGTGIVVISYTTSTLQATGGTITTSGDKTIHTFTTSGTFTL